MLNMPCDEPDDEYPDSIPDCNLEKPRSATMLDLRAALYDEIKSRQGDNKQPVYSRLYS
jgi:hypothetical protein